MTSDSDDEGSMADRLNFAEIVAHAKRFAELEKENAMLVDLVRDLIDRCESFEARLLKLEKGA